MSGLHEVSSEPIERAGACLIVSRLGRIAGLADLRGKTGYLMVSVKNPNFSGRLVDTFCDLVETHFGIGEVILVDTPYAATITATEADEAVRKKKLDNLKGVAGERRRFVERLLAKRDTFVPVRSFDEVEREVAPALVFEVRHAFEIEGRFRRAILDRTREVIPATIPAELLPLFAEFLVLEIPVLCSLYYARSEPGVADVYPGEIPELFWDIERGLYADELPEISRLAEHSPGLLYVDVRLNRGEAGEPRDSTEMAREP